MIIRAVVHTNLAYRSLGNTFDCGKLSEMGRFVIQGDGRIPWGNIGSAIELDCFVQGFSMQLEY